MENIQSLLQIYQTGFVVCAVVAAMALAVGLIIFFRFDIRTNFAIRTGRAEKITVKKLQGKNGKTDSLGQIDMDFTTDELPAAAKTDPADSGQTSPLKIPAESDRKREQRKAVQESAAGIRFEVTGRTIVIHTDEAI